MALKQVIDNDLKTALLGGNRLNCEVLRGLKAAILNQEVALGLKATGLSDEQIMTLIVQEIKKRREAAEIYQKAGRQELADKELAEVTILGTYLPEQLSLDELHNLVRQTALEQHLDLVPANMGRLIGAVKKQVGAQADGASVAQAVQKLINS